MQKPESLPLLAHFSRVGTQHKLQCAWWCWWCWHQTALPQHPVVSAKGSRCVGWAESCPRAKEDKVRVSRNRTSMPEELMIELGKMPLSFVSLFLNFFRLCSVFPSCLSSPLSQLPPSGLPTLQTRAKCLGLWKSFTWKRKSKQMQICCYRLSSLNAAAQLRIKIWKIYLK